VALALVSEISLPGKQSISALWLDDAKFELAIALTWLEAR
jgi:hypothetical protein